MLESIFSVPRSAHAALPETQFIQREGWRQIITPGVSGWLNEVSVSIIDSADADAVIDETCAEYARHGVRFRWSVTPQSRPADLGSRLERRGFQRVATRAMYRPIVAADSDLSSDAVEPVTEANIEAFCDVMIEGWGSHPEMTRRYQRAAFASSRHSLFLVRRGGRPVGGGVSTLHQHFAHLSGAIVLPEFRQSGAYRQLVDARICDAAKRGHAFVTTDAMEHTSAPLLERFGFSTHHHFAIYTSP